jgi:hypothetical protein
MSCLKLDRWTDCLTKNSLEQIAWIQGLAPAEMFNISYTSTPAMDLLQEFIKWSQTWPGALIEEKKLDSKSWLKQLESAQFAGPSILESFNQLISTKPLEYHVTNPTGTIVIRVLSSKADWIILQPLVEQILLMAGFMEARAKRRAIIINLVPLDVEKYATTDCIWNPDNINTGMTLGDQILIWRREEMVKVAIHELIHLYGFDLSDQYFDGSDSNRDRWMDRESKTLAQTFGLVSSEPRWNEGLTEAFATILNIILIAARTDKPKELLDLLLNYEHLHNRYSLVALAKSTENCTQLAETTSFFSYFYVKYIMLSNPNELFEILQARDYDKFQQRVIELLAQIELPKDLSALMSPHLQMSCCAQ